MIEPSAAAGLMTHELVAELVEPTDLPVLDVGAGSGNFTEFLRLGGWRPIAVDFDPVDYVHCAAPLVAADLEVGLPLRDSSAGGAVAIEVLEHLESPARLIRELSRVVTTGAWIVVTTPNILSWASKIELLVRDAHETFDDSGYVGNGHITPLGLPQLSRLGERAGLQVETVTYNVGKLPVPRLRHRLPLRHRRFRTKRLGECVIVKFRKVGEPHRNYARG